MSNMTPANDISNPQEERMSFDDQTRMRLRRHRQSLGLSYSALGRFLGLHGSTLQKWENGAIRKCSLRHQKILTRFLHGDYDADIHAKLGDPRRGAYLCPISSSAIECVKRLANCYRLLESRPDLRSLLLNAAWRAANEALRAMARCGRRRRR
ncbi:MAG: helix-turn-helix transcriptional regulator [Victivallales bacterium]|nr:helix-turn-helix transcriptional regulator [Victivallales bacterium]